MRQRKKSERRVVNEINELKCNKCETWLPEDRDNFQFRRDANGFRPTCKPCLKEAKSKYYKEDLNQEERKNSELKRIYGIEMVQYTELLESQDMGFAICGTKEPFGKSDRFKFFSVDHCHDTGKIRGLLCNHCNRGIGMLGDKSEIVYNAYKYLLRSEDDSTKGTTTTTNS